MMKAASTIGAKTVVTGSVHGDGDLEVYGRVEGDITVEGNVLIAATAEVKGSVTASGIRVAGAVEGNLQASDTVAIEPDARVLGDMTTPRVSIAEGAMVRGMVRTEAEQRPARRVAARAEESRSTDVGRGADVGRSVAGPSASVHAASVHAAGVHSAAVSRPAPVVVPPAERVVRIHEAPPAVPLDAPPPKKDKEARDRRPPEPRIPALAKGTKGKKKGDKRPH